jgi:hypothetical protein
MRPFERTFVVQLIEVAHDMQLGIVDLVDRVGHALSEVVRRTFQIFAYFG